MRQRRHYSERFKRDMASRVIDGGLTQARVARDVGINTSTLGRWVLHEKRRRESGLQLDGDAGPSDPIAHTPRALLQQLNTVQLEAQRLAHENEFLASVVDHLLDDRRAARRYEIVEEFSTHSEDDENNQALTLAVMCDALGVSRTGYTRWRQRDATPRADRQAELDRLVKEIYEASGGNYGAPRIVRALKERGIGVGHQTVYRSMYRQGFEGNSCDNGRLSATRAAAIRQVTIDNPELLDPTYAQTQPENNAASETTEKATKTTS